jgi:hypothetical protein
MMMAFDVIGYMKRKKLYCILCADEMNLDKSFPIFSQMKFHEEKFCDYCHAVIPIKLADWQCVSCGTFNQFSQKNCDGCNHKKGTKLLDF